MSVAPENMLCMEIWGGNEPVDTAVRLPGLDCWVYAKPYAEAGAGGDIHYVSSCATGRITRLLIADVSGHGTMVAKTAVALGNLMRRYVNYLDQTRFVEAINTQFAELSTAGTFATAIIATYFAPTGHLTICNAGHPSPLLYRHSEDKWLLLKVDEAASLPLGIEKVLHYDQFTVHIKPGDLVFCYTDSFIESYKNESDFVGMDGLVDIARKFAQPQAEGLIAQMVEALTGLHPKNLKEDDVTALVFQPVGKQRKPSGRQKIKAVGRFIRSMARPKEAPWPDLKLPNVGGAIVPALGRRWKR